MWCFRIRFNELTWVNSQNRFWKLPNQEQGQGCCTIKSSPRSFRICFTLLSRTSEICSLQLSHSFQNLSITALSLTLESAHPKSTCYRSFMEEEHGAICLCVLFLLSHRKSAGTLNYGCVKAGYSFYIVLWLAGFGYWVACRQYWYTVW